MGKYNVIPTFIAGQEARRAADEQNYINERRKIEDPRKDRKENDVEAARAANIDQYGIQAADPTSYGQLEGIAQRKEMHPLDVAGKKASNKTAEFTQAEAEQESVRAGLGRFYSALQQSGATTPEQAAAWLGNQTPETLSQMVGQPTDPKNASQLIEQLATAPGGFESALRAARAGVGTPERYKQIVSGLGPDGKPVNMAISEDQAPGALPVSPDDRMHDLEVKQAEANIRATDALSVDRLRGPAAKAGKTTPEEDAQHLANVLDTIGAMRTTLDQALQAGAVTSDRTDPIANLFSGDNPAGRFVGGLTGDPKESLRQQIDQTATSLLTSLVNMGENMSSRLFDSNAEKAMWLEMLGKSGTYESRLAAVNKFEQFVQSRASDPTRASRVPAATGGTETAPAAPAAPGQPKLSARAMQFFTTPAPQPGIGTD